MKLLLILQVDRQRVRRWGKAEGRVFYFRVAVNWVIKVVFSGGAKLVLDIMANGCD